MLEYFSLALFLVLPWTKPASRSDWRKMIVSLVNHYFPRMLFKPKLKVHKKYTVFVFWILANGFVFWGEISSFHLGWNEVELIIYPLLESGTLWCGHWKIIIDFLRYRFVVQRLSEPGFRVGNEISIWEHIQMFCHKRKPLEIETRM